MFVRTQIRGTYSVHWRLIVCEWLPISITKKIVIANEVTIYFISLAYEMWLQNSNRSTLASFRWKSSYMVYVCVRRCRFCLRVMYQKTILIWLTKHAHNKIAPKHSINTALQLPTHNGVKWTFFVTKSEKFLKRGLKPKLQIYILYIYFIRCFISFIFECSPTSH